MSFHGLLLSYRTKGAYPSTPKMRHYMLQVICRFLKLVHLEIGSAGYNVPVSPCGQGSHDRAPTRCDAGRWAHIPDSYLRIYAPEEMSTMAQSVPGSDTFDNVQKTLLGVLPMIRHLFTLYVALSICMFSSLVISSPPPQTIEIPAFTAYSEPDSDAISISQQS